MGAGKMLRVPRVPKGGDHLTHDRLAAKVVMTSTMITMIVIMATKETMMTLT